MWSWGEGEVPSGGRGCAFGFLDGALGHGEMRIMGWVLCSVLAVDYCAVGDGLESCDRGVGVCGTIVLSPSTCQPYASQAGREVAARGRSDDALRPHDSRIVHRGVNSLYWRLLIAGHPTWMDFLRMKVYKRKRDSVSITPFLILEDKKVLIILSIQNSDEHSLPTMSYTPPFKVRSPSQRILRQCAGLQKECIACSNVPLLEPVPKDDMCCTQGSYYERLGKLLSPSAT